MTENSSAENVSTQKLICASCRASSIDRVMYLNGRALCWLCAWLCTGIVI